MEQMCYRYLVNVQPLFQKYSVHLCLADHDPDLQHLEFEGYPTAYFLSDTGETNFHDLKIDSSKRGPYAKKAYGLSHLSVSQADDAAAPRFQWPFAPPIYEDAGGQDLDPWGIRGSGVTCRDELTGPSITCMEQILTASESRNASCDCHSNYALNAKSKCASMLNSGSNQED